MINLISIVQFNMNSILTVLYIVIKYIQITKSECMYLCVSVSVCVTGSVLEPAICRGNGDSCGNENQKSRKNILMVSDQNGVSLLYIMLEIHHSGWEPSIFSVEKNRQAYFYLYEN